jgi:hypothetical protein
LGKRCLVSFDLAAGEALAASRIERGSSHRPSRRCGNWMGSI